MNLVMSIIKGPAGQRGDNRCINKGEAMWRLSLMLLLSTSLLQRRSSAALAGEAVDSNAEEWPVYMDDCYVAFLEDGMSKEDTDGFYRGVEQEAKRGLNVTKMAEMRETSKAFVFMGDNSSAEEVS